MKRSQVKAEYKWDLTEVYSDYDEWKKDIEHIDDKIEALTRYKGHLLDSSDSLLEFLKDQREVEKLLERLNFYTFLKSDEDLSETESQKYTNMIHDYFAKYNVKTSFVHPELLESDYDVIEQFMKEKEELREFERYFKELYRLKPHFLDPHEESTLTEIGNIATSFRDSSSFIRDIEMDFKTITDEDGNEVKLLASNLSKYSRSKERNVRKQVYDRECEAYNRSINSLTANYLGYLKAIEMEARYRHYNSYLEQTLNESAISREVYEKIKEFTKENCGAYQRYLKLIKDCLGVDELKPYDLSAPLVNGSDKKYTVEDAKDLILKTFSAYGDYYVKILKYAFDNHCIDFLPNENKATGWYSAYIPYAKPRVFGNFQDKILDVSSLCHELGHFVNQYRIIETQPPQYVYQSTFCAEVASLNNEIYFSFKMLEEEDDIEVKKEVLMNFIKTFAGNFFGAIRQALFEEAIHTAIVDGKALSSKDLCDEWHDISKPFYGDMLESQNSTGWAGIPHFFMGGGYYVFCYSTGIVGACNLAHKLLTQEDGIKEKFAEFLTLGDSMDPIDSLKVLGIDMEDDAPYQIAIDMFEDAIAKFYELLK